MKMKVAISIEEGPLKYVAHVAVPSEGAFKVATFRFKYLHLAQELIKGYLDICLLSERDIMRHHVQKLKELQS